MANVALNGLHANRMRPHRSPRADPRATLGDPVATFFQTPSTSTIEPHTGEQSARGSCPSAPRPIPMPAAPRAFRSSPRLCLSPFFPRRIIVQFWFPRRLTADHVLDAHEPLSLSLSLSYPPAISLTTQFLWCTGSCRRPRPASPTVRLVCPHGLPARWCRACTTDRCGEPHLSPSQSASR